MNNLTTQLRIHYKGNQIFSSESCALHSMETFLIYLIFLTSCLCTSNYHNFNIVYPDNLCVSITSEFHTSHVPWNKYSVQILYDKNDSKLHSLFFYTYAESISSDLLYVQWPPMLLLIKTNWQIVSATLESIRLFEQEENSLTDSECLYDCNEHDTIVTSICPHSLSNLITRFHLANPNVLPELI